MRTATHDTRMAEAFAQEVVRPLAEAGVEVRDAVHYDDTDTIAAVVVLPNRDEKLRQRVLTTIQTFVLEHKDSVSVEPSLIYR